MLVGRLLWCRLTDIPEFDDPISVEPEDMDQRGAAVAGPLRDARVNRHPVAILEGALNLQLFVWVLGCVFFHGEHQRLRVAAEERIVVKECWVGVPVEGLSYFPRRGKVQEILRRFFVSRGRFHDAGHVFASSKWMTENYSCSISRIE
jgi:hypothetical protein